MDFTTYLPILLVLGLIILPELSGNNSCEGSCNSCNSCNSRNNYNQNVGRYGCNSPTCPDNTPRGCENGGSAMITRCSDANIDVSGVRFKRNPEEICPCQLQEIQDLVDNGYETWRLDPVAVAARFMQNCFIDECYRGIPTYLAGTCRTCDRLYVVLGVGCAGCMAFELCQPIKQGECGIWVVTRYGKYNCR